jgi:hypothetical protein
VWFVLAGLLGMRHEATVAHVVDPITGEIHHASARQLERHAGTQSDYHTASPHDFGDDVCAISAALHQAIDLTTARATVVATTSWTTLVKITITQSTAIAVVYRLAPKTSPPARA